jgi:hypothetical protein
MFFSEEKNQKTFLGAARLVLAIGLGAWARSAYKSLFGSFSSEKELLPYLSRAKAPWGPCPRTDSSGS